MRNGLLLVVSWPCRQRQGNGAQRTARKKQRFLLFGFGDYASAAARPAGRGKLLFPRPARNLKSALPKGGCLNIPNMSGIITGTPRDYVDAALADGKNVILEIEVDGAAQVKRLFPSAVLVFLVRRILKRLSAVCAAATPKPRRSLRAVYGKRRKKSCMPRNTTTSSSTRKAARRWPRRSCLPLHKPSVCVQAGVRRQRIRSFLGA